MNPKFGLKPESNPKKDPGFGIKSEQKESKFSDWGKA